VPDAGSAYGLAVSLAALTAASLTAVAFSAGAPFIRETFDLSEVEVGAIASCVYAGAAATSVAGGRLTDRSGPEPVLVLAAACLAVGAAGAATAPTPALFFAGVLAAGLGYGVVNPPTNVLSNPRSPRLRGLAMSVKQSGIPLGGVLAGAVVPAAAGIVGWRWAMVVPILGCAAVAAAAALGPRARRAPAGAPVPPEPGVRLRLPWAFAFGFLMAGVQVAVFTFLTVYLVDDRESGAVAAGASLALLLAGGLAGRPAWGWVSDRRHADRGRVLQVSAVLAAAFLAVLPVAGPAALPVVLVGIGACSVGWNGAYIAAVSEAVEPGRIGSASGKALLLVNLGAVVVPPLVGLLSASGTRWPLAWTCCAALSLASVAVLQLSRAPAAQPLPTGRR